MGDPFMEMIARAEIARATIQERAEYDAAPSGPCGWKFCGINGCILAETGRPCNG